MYTKDELPFDRVARLFVVALHEGDAGDVQTATLQFAEAANAQDAAYAHIVKVAHIVIPDIGLDLFIDSVRGRCDWEFLGSQARLDLYTEAREIAEGA